MDGFRDPAAQRRMAGVGMLEILVALLVLSIGVLGLAQLQGVATRQNYNGYLRSQATFLAASIVERMRANQDHAQDYVIGMDESAPSGGSRAAQDQRHWLNTLSSLLPSGDGQISYSGETYTITVQYDDNRDPDDTPVRVTVETGIGS